MRSILFAMLLAAGGASAQSANDPNLANPTHVVTAKIKDYTIAGMVTHLAGAKSFAHGIALFPGHPGVMKIREEGGAVRYGQVGNFLVRSRRHWLDEETLVVVVDAPSDQWIHFGQAFRATPRYAADVAALIAEVGQRFPVKQWTFVGTSEGSISAYYAAQGSALKPRLILTSSLVDQTRLGPGLTLARWDGWDGRLLWVHHFDDPCRSTSYREVRRQAERSRSPILTVRGGDRGRGDACEAFTAHGFVGLERPTVLAMRSWVKTGTVPPDVSR